MKRRGGGFFDFFKPNQIPEANQNLQANQNPVSNQIPEANQNPEEPGVMDKVIGTASETYESVKGDLGNQVGLVTEEAEQLAEQGSNLVNQGKDALSSVFRSSNTEAPVPGGPQVQGSVPVAPDSDAPVIGQGQVEEKKWYEIWKGGRRRSKSRQMMGGLSSNLAYYAAPVTDAKVAEPTYMMQYTGGRKSRKRTCKRRRHKCCKKSCRKHHRHHYKR